MRRLARIAWFLVCAVILSSLVWLLAPSLAEPPTTAASSGPLAAADPPAAPIPEAVVVSSEREPKSWHTIEWVPEVITQATTLTLAGSPYFSRSIHVEAGQILTIEAGVVISFTSDGGLRVDGELRTLGTAAQPITFTTQYGEGENKWWYAWDNVTFSELATPSYFDGNGSYAGGSILRHVVMEYVAGTYEIDAAISSQVPLLVEASTIQNVSGRGISVVGGSRIVSNTISGIWTRDLDGGGIYASGTSTNQVVIEGNTISGVTLEKSSRTGQGLKGGGIYAANAVVKNNTITGNRAATGAGIYAVNSIVSNNVITGNTAVPGESYYGRTVAGGGLYAGYSEVSNNTISDNVMPYGDGSGVYAADSLISNNVVAGNRISGANSARGLGIYAESSTLSGNAVRDNHPDGWAGEVLGGGVYLKNSTMADSEIWNNSIRSSSSVRGAGVYAENSTLTRNQMLSNTSTISGSISVWEIASTTGAGVYATGGTLRQNLIQGNRSVLVDGSNKPMDGHGVSLADGVTFENNTVVNNLGPAGDGVSGGAYVTIPNTQTGIRPRITGNNIYGNTPYDLHTPTPLLQAYSANLYSLNASGNYWGTASESTVLARIYDYYDDADLERVAFTPFLSAPAAGAPWPLPGTTLPPEPVLPPAPATGTIVGGPIYSDTSWPASGSPYTATSSVYLAPGATLKIGPGVEVRFDSGRGLLVDGALRAQGTVAQPITFTSSASSKSAGDWKQILFSPQAAASIIDDAGSFRGGSILQGVVVEYAGGSDGAVSARIPLLVEGSTIRHNGTRGVKVSDGSRIIGNTISDNLGGNGAGIYASAVSADQVVIDGNTVSGNRTTSGSTAGAGIYASNAIVSNNTVKANENFDYSVSLDYRGYGFTGGGIYATGSVITNNVIAENRAIGGYTASGGGIYVRESVVANNVIFKNRISSIEGGYGLGIRAISSTLSSNVVSDHYADRGRVYGGGVYLRGSTMTDSEIRDNLGDGVYAENSTLTANRVLSNTSTANGTYWYFRYPPDGGAGIRASNSVLRYNLVQGNRLLLGGTAYGTLLPASGVSLIDGGMFEYNTVVNNTGPLAGLALSGGVFVAGGRPTMAGNSIYGNSPYDLFDFNQYSTSATLDATNSYWGTASGSTVLARIYDYFDDARLERVTYQPFLAAAHSSAPPPLPGTTLPEEPEPVPTPISGPTYVGGPIEVDTTWTPQGNPYIASGSVFVNAGTVLTIEAGVMVQFGQGHALQVDGTLKALGTAEQPITFTSGSSLQNAGDWKQVLFSLSAAASTFDSGGNYTGGSILRQVVVEYAGGSEADGAISSQVPLLVEGSTVRNNASRGVLVLNGSRVISSTISNNASLLDGGGLYAVSDNPENRVVVEGNTISGNSVSRGYSDDGYGGGLYAGNALVRNNTITANTINSYYHSVNGAGLYATTSEVSNNVVADNRGNGGYSAFGLGIYSWSSTLSQNTVRGNHSVDVKYDGEGGGVYMQNSLMTDSDVFDNSLKVSYNATGAGVFAASNSTLTGNRVYSNAITLAYNSVGLTEGAGIFAAGGTLRFNLVQGNRSVLEGNARGPMQGHGVSLAGASTFEYNTVVNNTGPSSSTRASGGVYVTGHPTLVGNTIYGNTNFDLYDDNEYVPSESLYLPNNYWGTTSSSAIDSRIYDHVDDPALEPVVYAPFLSAPDSRAPDSTIPTPVPTAVSTNTPVPTTPSATPTPTASPTPSQTATPTPTPSPTPTATARPVISFWPSSQTIAAGSVFSVEVRVSAGPRSIVSVDAYFDYDPAYLELVDEAGQPVSSGGIISSTAMPQVNFSEANNGVGQAAFSAGIALGAPPVSGDFVLATLRLRAKPEAPIGSSTVQIHQASGSLDPRKTLVVDADNFAVEMGFEAGRVEISLATLVGSVQFQARDYAPNDRWRVPITVSLHAPGVITPTFQFTPTTDATGRFTVTGIAPGTYDISVKKARSLSNSRASAVLVAGTSSVDFGRLLEGDANDDEVVNSMDYSPLATAYFKLRGQDGFVERVDFNDDGRIDAFDYAVLATNYFKRGDIRG